MATQNNLHIPEDLLAELQERAVVQGKSVDALAEEALRKGLEDTAWRDLMEYGRKTGLESGYTEADVPEIIQRRRRMRSR